MRKKTTLAAGTLLCLAVVLCTRSGKEKMEVTVTRPEYGSICESIPAMGKIMPEGQVKVSPDVSGEITLINFQEGDRVEQGDLVMRIKQETYLSAVERAYAALNASKAQMMQQKVQLEQARSTRMRDSMLFAHGVIAACDWEKSQSDLEIAESLHKAAGYHVQSARAELKEAQENLRKTDIFAPIGGVISQMNVEVGERVVGTSQMNGTELFRIADLGKMEVITYLNEMDVVKVCESSPAVIRLDAWPDREFRGTVTQIANSAGSALPQMQSGQTAVFEVKIKIAPDSYADLLEMNRIPFRSGMNASVSVLSMKKNGIFKLPLQCITVRKEQTGTSMPQGKGSEQVFVFNGRSGRVERRNVTTGIQDLTHIEIRSGIEPQEQVVTGPYRAISKDLENGSKVKIKTRKTDE